MTANGLTDSNEITIMDHEGLGQCKLHVLNQTPAVLSIGSRCTKEGYTFVWPEGEDVKPVMINCEGVCTFLEVDGDIPYLIPDKVPDESTVQEGKNNLIKHLECLIQTLKADRGNSENVNNPKAMAGGDLGEELFAPSGEEPEEPSKEDKDPKGEEEEPPPRPEPEEREDPEGLIEVDVEHGESRYAKPGTLKREAKTLDHLMTHGYSNPYCDSCIRAKMKGSFKRKLSKFGDLIMHLTSLIWER